jgi:hypothetical protein
LQEKTLFIDYVEYLYTVRYRLHTNMVAEIIIRDFKSDEKTIKAISKIQSKPGSWFDFAGSPLKEITEKKWGPVENVGLFVDESKLVVGQPTDNNFKNVVFVRLHFDFFSQELSPSTMLLWKVLVTRFVRFVSLHHGVCSSWLVYVEVVFPFLRFCFEVGSRFFLFFVS